MAIFHQPETSRNKAGRRSFRKSSGQNSFLDYHLSGCGAWLQGPWLAQVLLKYLDPKNSPIKNGNVPKPFALVCFFFDWGVDTCGGIFSNFWALKQFHDFFGCLLGRTKSLRLLMKIHANSLMD